jgi:NAD-dependent dihydropyrimidine dehydrogenase PreA subunit
MLIISRHRQEADDSHAASLLAAKFNTVVWSIPFLYDFPSDSPTIQRLRSLPEPAHFIVPLSQRATKKLLNQLQIPYAEVFETTDAVQIPDGGICGGLVESLSDTPSPRWYPIIDDSKCTACLECVNYCLFGVYSIGDQSRPFVDQPDACRDGCPACARVCPSKAIMFPLYEDRIIAGYEQDSPDDLNNLVDLVDQI